MVDARDVRGQPGARRARRCARDVGAAAGRAVRAGAARRRSRRDPARLPGSRLPERHGRGASRSSAENGTRVDVAFAIREGPQVFVDHVLIVGNVRTSTETIERELQVKPGDPFSLGAINESQRRLTALGLFRRARITELRHGDETTRDLLVTVEEAPPTTIGYGGGVEGRLRRRRSRRRTASAAEQFEFAPRAFFEIGRRNLFGKNRSVNFFTSVSLHHAARDAARRSDRVPRASARSASRACSTPPPTRSSTHVRAAAALELQLLAAQRQRRHRAGSSRARSASPAAIRSSAPRCSTRSSTDAGPAADRPRCFRRSACRRSRRRSSATRATIRSIRRAASYVSASGQLAGPRDRIGGRLREVVLHRAGVSHAAAHQPDRVRRQRAARAGGRLPARGVDDGRRAVE